MYIQLIRNQPQGSAITGRLVINGRWFCYTLERVGYQIPALCYHVAVTQSPRFKRLQPIVQNVPQRTGIRFHRGTKPEHSTGCILVVADNINDNTDNMRSSSINDNTDNLRGSSINDNTDNLRSSSINDNIDNLRGNQLPAAPKENNPCRSRDIDSSGTLSPLSSINTPIGCRSAADVENQLTQLLFQTQNAHEEIILEVTDFRPGTEYGYNTPCPSSILETTSFSDDC